MTDRYKGEYVRVCHKVARIVEENEHSFTAEAELGGVDQHIVLSEAFVEERLGEGQ